MNGGTACRRRSFVWTADTTKSAPRSSASAASASAWLRIFAAAPPWRASRASNSGGSGPASRAVTCQYSSGTNASISRSRSQMSFSATDCTRPALRPRRTLSQRIGLIL